MQERLKKSIGFAGKALDKIAAFGRSDFYYGMCVGMLLICAAFLLDDLMK